MATLRYTQIRKHPGGTVRYIANREKIISHKAHDVYNVLCYMGSPESTERIYSFSRHCSQNPDLAEKQIELYRERYYTNKRGGIQGLTKGKQELLGLHFFMSYTEADDPSEATMNKIASQIAEHPKLRDFPVFGANHFDQKHKHTHFFVSSYSSDGNPRKLCLRKEDYNEIRRFANRCCVACGLSIIDLSTLRYNNPEYSEWVDSVIAEGKVVVHSEKEDHKKKPKQKIPTRNIYYKWKKEEEKRGEEEYQLMTDLQRQRKNFEEMYYYTPDENPNQRWYVSGDAQQRFYTISLVSKDGYRRTNLELAVRFVLFVANYEGKYIRRNSPEIWLEYNAHVDKKLQGMYDCLRTANEMNIQTPNEVATRIADVGKQINALRREKARHEKSIAKHKQIIEAYETYTQIRSSVEDNPVPQQDVVCAYKKAYAILAQNQVLTAEAFAKLCRRYAFEKQKIVDYDKRIPELNRQYRNLKKLEALAVHATDYLLKIYTYSEMAHERASKRDIPEQNNGDIDRLIGNARSRVAGNTVPHSTQKEY